MRRTGDRHTQWGHSKTARYSIRLYLKIIFQFVFYFIGTYLHELAHWLACKLVGAQVTAFDLIPRVKKGYIVYGSVQSRVTYRAMFIPIALAPLIWWVALYFFLQHMQVVTVKLEADHLSFAFAYQQFQDWQTWWIIYVSLQLLWAGRPSDQDFAVFWQGVFSVSGSIVIALLVASVWFYWERG